MEVFHLLFKMKHGKNESGVKAHLFYKSDHLIHAFAATQWSQEDDGQAESLYCG